MWEMVSMGVQCEMCVAHQRHKVRRSMAIGALIAEQHAPGLTHDDG